MSSIVERRRLQHVVRRPGLIPQPQLLGLAAKGRAGQDRQVEHLRLRVCPGAKQEVDAAPHRIDRIARQAEDQIDAGLDPFGHDRLDAPLERRQVGRPAHQLPRPRLDRLQPDLDFVEIGLAEQPGQFGVDPFGPQLAGKRQPAARIAAAKQPQKIGEIGPLVERRIQQHDFRRPVLGGVAQIGQDLLGREEAKPAWLLG